MIRKFFSTIAKIIYHEQFLFLKEQVLKTYEKLDIGNCTKFTIIEKILISGEDHRFRYHIGFDIIAIIRAFRNRFIYHKIEGASTIEQQLVRVLTGKYEKTADRKIREIFLATTLIEIIPRKYIPKLYLSLAYYGTSMQGLNQVYQQFGIVTEKDVTESLAAEIIARIKYPEPKNYSRNRLQQISFRKAHLLRLYKKHTSRKLLKIY